MAASRRDQITSRDVQALKAALSHRSAKHTNNVLTTLSTMLKIAVEWELIEAIPCKIELLPTSSEERPFCDFDQYEWLLDAAERIDPRTHLVVLLGGSACLRVGEIIALEQSDIDHRRGFARCARPGDSVARLSLVAVR